MKGTWQIGWAIGSWWLALGARAQSTGPAKPADVVELDRPVAAAPATGQVPARVPPRALAPLEPAGKRIYDGVCINAESTAAFPGRIARYVARVGHRPSVLVQFAHAYDRDHALDWSYYAPILRTIDRQGLIPFLKATTQTWDNDHLAKTRFFFRADDILAGRHDAFFVRAAQVCRDFGKPMFMSWDHEMNGDWYSYSEAFARRRPDVGSDWTAEKYVAFFRRVRRIFREQHADNVAFAFAPVLVGRRLGALDETQSWKAYYPGDAYVDWIAPSYYNEIRPETLDVIAAETNKPIFMSEWGTCAARTRWYPGRYPGDGPWVARSLELWLNRYPNVKGSAYFEWDRAYAIERDPAQLAAYRAALDDPRFIHGTSP